MSDPKHILIIDDDRIVAEALKMVIVNTATQPVEVDVALTGASGFDAIMFNPYDLVFMDLRMPHWNGPEVVQSLKMVNASVRVVIYSGCVQEFRSELAELGVDAILQKPCPAQTIRDTVSRLLADTPQDAKV